MNKKDVIVLIDEPLDIDRRVQNIIKKYHYPIIEDCSGLLPLSQFMYFQNASILFKSLILAPFYWFKLNKKYILKPKNIFEGTKLSIRIHSTAINKCLSLINKYKNQNIRTIYANDLRCGIIGMYLAKYLNADLIYDAHEVEFHRNRKNSLLRVVFDIITEQEVINKASQIIVVSKPISDLYRYIYQISKDKISIVNNHFYESYYGYALDHFDNQITNKAITYVGAGIKGRQLENLSKEAIKTDINLYGFFLLENPQTTSGKSWILGSKKYLPELLELVKTNRLAMWACVDNICLSYRLSLGNKFFQAIAIGIPVIASKGTYLADIVTKYDLGYVYDNSNLIEIIHKMQNNKKYLRILKSIKDFQIKLFSKEITL